MEPQTQPVNPNKLILNEEDINKIVTMSFLDSYNIWDKRTIAIDRDQETYKIPLTQQEQLGLFYLKRSRDHLVKVGLSELSFWEGRHRTGKSLGAIVRSCLFDPEFEKYLESRVCHDIKAYARSIEQIENSKQPLNCIVIDEAGSVLSGQDWNQVWSKSISKTTQVFGYLHPCISFCSPLRSQVKSDIRRMAHLIFKANRMNKKESFFYVYESNFNSMIGTQGKFYYPKPEVELRGECFKLNKLILPLPPARIVERYAEIETARKSPMLKQLLLEVRQSDAKAIKEEVDINAVVERVVNDFKMFQSTRSKPDKPIVDLTLLEFSTRLPSKYCRTIKTLAERKLRENAEKVSDAIKAVKDDIKDEKMQTSKRKELAKKILSNDDVDYSNYIEESLGDEKR